MNSEHDLELVFMGTGTSHGVPMIGCSCETCLSDDPRDNRTNASLLIRYGGKDILIDCGRDFRIQAIREGLRKVDRVLLTHTHFDHIAGIDDLRVFNRSTPIPVCGKADHLAYIKRYIYHYLFETPKQRGGGITSLSCVPVKGPFMVEGILFEPLEVHHGKLKIFGYRFRDIAYLSDVSFVPEAVVERLSGLRLLIVDALRHRPHSTHFCLTDALNLVHRVRPDQTYLTHITHDFFHERVGKGLKDPASGYYTPLAVNLAYDGLTISSDS